MSKSFTFKEFQIDQDNCAMKVGTDSILLGAWVDVTNPTPKRILDIGTGTGVLALMLAQRTDNSFIQGIEIDRAASIQAKQNISNSPWANRINIQNIALQEFSSAQKYELIVSNPPYFDFHNNKNSRSDARQQTKLTYEELIKHSASLLSKGGKISIIIPYLSETKLIDIASSYYLYPRRICQVKSLKSKPFNRSILEFSFIQKTIIRTNLILEETHHVYTKEYQKIVKDFYLYL